MMIGGYCYLLASLYAIFYRILIDCCARPRTPGSLKLYSYTKYYMTYGEMENFYWVTPVCYIDFLNRCLTNIYFFYSLV
jgi:hypothetical protein